MWGDYHLLELALWIRRMARNEPYYAFFDPAIQSVKSAAGALTGGPSDRGGIRQ